MELKKVEKCSILNSGKIVRLMHTHTHTVNHVTRVERRGGVWWFMT